ncbi:MAG: glycerate kinase [Syntrophorhabdaceae bacterium]|nr:glycerate kinase [Syntrophorhabdaceae bacterium]
MNSEEIKNQTQNIFNAAISSVNPYSAVKAHTGHILSFCHKHRIKQFFIIGFGKASFDMARAINDGLGKIIKEGIVITKYGHAKGMESIDKIKIYEAGHPIPDENGVEATNKIIRLLEKVDESTLVVCLISGGGSALLVSPLKPITLQEKQITTKMLLDAGADINEVNTLRKHISSVKGGRLARIAYPAHIKSLILSDVIGDRLDVIASGPTTLDKTTYADALEVIKRYGLSDKIPYHIMEVINKGIKGEMPETIKEKDPVLSKVENIIIGSNKIALSAAGAKASELGFHVEILSTEIDGEAKEVGKRLAGIAKAYKTKKKQSETKRPICLLSGGETTVKVVGKGLGGRNTELALAFAIEIEGEDGIAMLSAGTDGTDGPTDAAGAYVTGQTIKRAKELGLNPYDYLLNNDSYNFFKKIDSLFITGPTGTNVMDIQIILTENP